MIRRPPRSTLDRSSAASDVYKRQSYIMLKSIIAYKIMLMTYYFRENPNERATSIFEDDELRLLLAAIFPGQKKESPSVKAVSYTHLRAHETVLDLVCRLLLEKKNKYIINTAVYIILIMLNL